MDNSFLNQVWENGVMIQTGYASKTPRVNNCLTSLEERAASSVCRPAALLSWAMMKAATSASARRLRNLCFLAFTRGQCKNKMSPFCFHLAYLIFKSSLGRPVHRVKLEIRRRERERRTEGWRRVEAGGGVNWKATKLTVYKSHMN